MRAEELRSRMNVACGSGVPFLFAVDFELSEGIFIERPLEQDAVLFNTPLGGNRSDICPPDRRYAMTPSPKAFADYRRQFDVVMEGLRNGDSFLTNLTVRTPVSVDISLEDIFLRSRSPYRLCLPDRFVCFSPERFVKIAGGVISTNPMKGTISCSVPDAADVILADPKETAEHYTVVDLLRNDLGMVADDIKVTKFRYIDRIRTSGDDILQVSSRIEGRLPADYMDRMGDIVFRMLPAGSVSGAPKRSTVDIIRRAECEPRGFYCGVFGYFDGNELDSAVMIRFMESRGGEVFFRSGGGITVSSDARKEYREVIDKIYLPFL